MAQEMVKRICEHCGTIYTTFAGKADTHCVHCFFCESYRPFDAMYGRVAGKGYCCRECESTERWSTRLAFDVVLNFPRSRSFSR